VEGVIESEMAHLASSASPTSWRDVYTLVQAVEERLTNRMDSAAIERRAIMTDHEGRLRAVEISGAAASTLALAVTVQDGRLKAVENAILSLSSREGGMLSTLGAGKTAVVVMAAAFGAVVAGLDIIARLAGA